MKKEWRSTRWGPNNYLWVGSRTSIYGGYSSRYPFYKAILIIYRLWFQIIRRVRDSPQTSILLPYVSIANLRNLSPQVPSKLSNKKFQICGVFGVVFLNVKSHQKSGSTFVRFWKPRSFCPPTFFVGALKMWDKTRFRHWVAVIVSKLFLGGNRKTVPFTSLRIVFMKTLNEI